MKDARIISMRRMSSREFNHYRVEGVLRLAAAEAKAYQLSMEQATAAAESSFESLVPEGWSSIESRHLYTLLKAKRRIGSLWFQVKRRQSQLEAYLLDIFIEPRWRSCGYGEMAMLMFESEAGRLGIARFALNVFADNTPAVGLYRKLGYRVASSLMMKQL